MVKNWFGHLRAFEYEHEYRFTEYENEEIRPEARPRKGTLTRMALPVGIKGLRSGGSDRVQLRLRAGLSQQGE